MQRTLRVAVDRSGAQAKRLSPKTLPPTETNRRCLGSYDQGIPICI